MLMYASALTLVCALLQESTIAGGPSRRTSNAGCPCITEFPTTWAAKYIANGSCQILDGPAYTGNVDERNYCYPINYGLAQCQPFDEELPPFCRNADGSIRFDAPSWCTDSWCYVDQDSCSLGDEDDLAPSARQVAGKQLMFSYATCGLASNYAKFRRAALMSATEVVGIVEEYVAEVRDFVEQQAHLIRTSEGGAVSCEFMDSCDCQECEPGQGSWKSMSGVSDYSITFKRISVVHRGDTSKDTPKEQAAQCLSRLLEGRFKKIMRMEYDDPTRMGFLYYGDQASGIAFWLPGTQWCTSPTSVYDPRFRPWYVSAVSGPKDIILVLDQSNSMRQPASRPRWGAVVDAAKQVIATLNEFDYASIVVFHSLATSFDDLLHMVPVTEANRAAMDAWLDSLIPIGATNFRKAFEKAFTIIDNSHRFGHSSGCNGKLLFLTDGMDKSTLLPADVKTLNVYNFSIFTYSFGDDADKARAQELACANGGIHYHVDDGGNVGDAMSNYYHFYAGALSGMKQIRWTPYQDFATGNDLIAGCLPVYDRSGGGHRTDPLLHGVVCMDVSIIIANAEFRQKDDFENAMQLLTGHSQKCNIARHTEEELERLRAEMVGQASTCKTPEANFGAGTASCGFRVKIVLLLFLIFLTGGLQAEDCVK